MSKILVIDDNPLMRRTMLRILNRNGHEVILAKDGIEGVEMHVAELPDLTITDIMMPRQGGLKPLSKFGRGLRMQGSSWRQVVAISTGWIRLKLPEGTALQTS